MRAFPGPFDDPRDNRPKDNRPKDKRKRQPPKKQRPQNRNGIPLTNAAGPTGPITIDGKADEPAWQQARADRQFRPAVAGEKRPPAEDRDQGQAAVGPRNLYFFADMEDDDLFADSTEHDGRTWHNDVFELFFRPDDNKPPYYEFQVNAAGTMLDMFFRAEGRAVRPGQGRRRIPLEAKVVRRGTLDNRTDRDEGWSVEGRIPWDDFSAPAAGPPRATPGVRPLPLRLHAERKAGTSTCAPLSQPSFHLLEDYARLSSSA